MKWVRLLAAQSRAQPGQPVVTTPVVRWREVEVTPESTVQQKPETLPQQITPTVSSPT